MTTVAPEVGSRFMFKNYGAVSRNANSPYLVEEAQLFTSNFAQLEEFVEGSVRLAAPSVRAYA